MGLLSSSSSGRTSCPLAGRRAASRLKAMTPTTSPSRSPIGTPVSTLSWARILQADVDSEAHSGSGGNPRMWSALRLARVLCATAPLVQDIPVTHACTTVPLCLPPSQLHLFDGQETMDKRNDRKLSKKQANKDRQETYPFPEITSPMQAEAKPSMASLPTNSSLDLVKPSVRGTLVFLPTRTLNCCAATPSPLFLITLPLPLPGTFDWTCKTSNDHDDKRNLDDANSFPCYCAAERPCSKRIKGV